MMAKITSIYIGLILFTVNMAYCQSSTINYKTTNSEISNPERGWYDDYYSHHGGKTLGSYYDSLDVNTLISNREEDNITLIHRNFYLHEFLDKDSVSEEYLSKMQYDFDAIRKAGVKCIIRFAYSASEDAEVWDATVEKVFSHIASLAPILQKNSDVISGVQAGFVGVWGEWYYTKNFAGPGYHPDDTDQENRRLLVEKLLEILPEHISVQTRTPAIMRNIVETDEPISEAEAYTGSVKSRVGHHNDCFLANRSDYGTYENVDEDIAYLNESTKYTITGGETCDASNDYSNCENGLQRMKDLHWTYLNRDYNMAVYSKWKTQGCYKEINILLGYRIALLKAVIGDSVKAGSDLEFAFEMENVGYASPMLYKPIQIVLTNTQTQEHSTLAYQGSNNDIRYWLPGKIKLAGKVTIPDSLQDGNYAIGLKFPDQDVNLAKNNAYAIQLANVGIWDSETGINNLNHIVSVGNGGIGDLPETPKTFDANPISETEISITWTGNTEGILGYEIMRSRTNDDNWILVAEPGSDEILFTDNELDSGTKYSYIIRSKNMYGYSDWSLDVSATTLGVSGVSDIFNDYKIYPNPLHNSNLLLQFNDNSEKQIMISSLTGQIIYNTTTTSKEINIDRSFFESGIFVVSIFQKNNLSSSKLIVY